MSLYDTMKSLPADKRLKYEGAHGTTAMIDVEATASGALYTILRAQTTDSMGQPRVTSRGYSVSASADCRDIEQSLRDLGIDPDKYSIV
jgi:hypothetical protein